MEETIINGNRIAPFLKKKKVRAKASGKAKSPAKKKATQRRRSSYTDEQFIRAYAHAYNNAGSTKEVAERLGVSTTAVYNRTAYLRQKGVKLPEFRKRVSTVNELNNLVRKLIKR